MICIRRNSSKGVTLLERNSRRPHWERGSQEGGMIDKTSGQGLKASKAKVLLG